MAKYNIPTAGFKAFTDYAEATALLTALAEQHPDVGATIVELDL